MRRTRLFVRIPLLVLLCAAPSALYAQLTRGAINGTVRDTSGALVPGATITVTNLDTNLVRTAKTNAVGLYRVPALDPGRYSVMVEQRGFSRVENRALEVVTAQELTFNVELNASTVTETIDVSAEAVGVTLNKTNATIGLTATARQATELPLSAGRDVNQLALLSPNAFSAPGSTTISVNGQRARNDNFTIDGTDDNDISVTLQTLTLPPEAVSEFQVQTNAYNAEFGRSTGGQLNVITRSGTNRLHGDAWEYYRASGLNALDNIEKNSLKLTDPARLVRHQTGLGFGGPIVKDQTFFYAVVQRESLRSSASQGATIRIPTSNGLAALQNVPLRTAQQSVTLPQTAQSLASRQAMLGSLAFLNDVLATNPQFTSIQNVSVNGVPIETGNVVITRTAPTDDWFYLLRVDHQFSAQDHLTARFSAVPETDKNLVSNTEFGARFSGDQKIRDYNTAVSETHSLGSHALNELRVSFIRRNLDFPENDPVTPTTTITGMFTIGGLTNYPQSRIQNSYQFSDVFSYQSGRHSLRAGFDIRYIHLDSVSAFNSKGSYGFDNLQSFMNNSANTFTQALQVSSFLAKQTQQFYFAQDDFRVSPDLTLNLGLRYETSGVPLGYFGATDPQVLAILVPPPVKRDNNNIGPRLGFAYSPHASSGLLGTLFGDGRTVIRGGYGRSFDVLFYNILTVNASNYPRVYTAQVLGVEDVFPKLAPVSGAPTYDKNTPLASFVNTPVDAQNPEAHIYSLSVQREIARDFVFEVGYTGSRSLHGINQEQANPAILTPDQAAAVRSGQAIPNAQTRRIFPSIGSRTLIATDAQATYNAGFATITKRFSHGLEFGLAYTYGKLLSNNDESLNVADVTRASPQIPQDYLRYGDEKGLSAFDRKHRFVVHYIYEIPWFKASWAQSPIVKQIFSGWQLSGITSAQSGQPFTILTGVDSNGNGTSGGDRPNVVAGGTLTLDPVTNNFRTFTAPLVGGLFSVPLGSNGLPLANSLGDGNLGRNTYRAPGYWITNLSLAKRFAISGDHNLVLRIDALNAFNQDNYGIPIVSMSSASFGTNTNNWGNRSLTLSAKYTF